MKKTANIINDALGGYFFSNILDKQSAGRSYFDFYLKADLAITVRAFIIEKKYVEVEYVVKHMKEDNLLPEAYNELLTREKFDAIIGGIDQTPQSKAGWKELKKRFPNQVDIQTDSKGNKRNVFTRPGAKSPDISKLDLMVD